MKTNEEILYDMKVGEALHYEVDSKNGPKMYWVIMRVPTGWIYTPMTGNYETSVFVPLTNYSNPNI